MASSPNIDESDLIDPKNKASTTERLLALFQKVKWKLFFACLVFLLVLLVGIIIYVEVYISSFDMRIDCNPDLPLNYERCLNRGCIWVQRKDDLEPPCFFPHGYGYHLKQVRNSSNGFNVDLERSTDKSVFGKEVKNVNLQVYFETPQRLRFKFVDLMQKRYEVPLDIPQTPAVSPKEMAYEVEFVDAPQFGIVVRRKSNGNIIFDTNVPGMIFSDQFIQISTKLSSSNVYGLGEHASSEYRHNMNWKSYSYFSRDTVPDNDDNLYGTHPFYMNVEKNGQAHGVFLLNSNAMEIVSQPHPALTFRTIGGILDFFIFLGPSPEEVVKEYLNVIGLPMMPPYWSLGFHLSRYGYQNVDEVKTVMERTIKAKIPYDVQHFDIDYMQDRRDFTFDAINFQTLPSFVDELHARNRRVIVILDPAIASNKTLRGNYKPLDSGLDTWDIFIKMNGTVLEGEVWPGKTYFPDFSHSNAFKYWAEMCDDFHKQVAFDGLWIDMNEPSNFAAGSLNGCAMNSLNYPPYAAGILGSERDRRMFEKTLCMDSVQQAGKHYDVHSLYGLFQANVTHRALADIFSGIRPMILTRSTYSGSGKYAAHWLGDNNSSWPQMRNSIPGMLDFNLFGMPLVGADICGFRSNVSIELCHRWMQLGAFYPFSRNHNALGCTDQDPAVFGEAFVEISRKALLTRYELLPYLYTLFHLAHTEGSTVARPLLHEFPQDEVTWSINEQFLWGPALLISPIIYEEVEVVKAYFPKGVWFDFYTGNEVKNGDGKYLTLKDEGNTNLHVRGGYIIPLQKPSTTTKDSRNNSMGIFIAPNDLGSASGMLFLDDGISFETQSRNLYHLLQFDFKKTEKENAFSSEIKKSGYDGAAKLQFGYITVCKQPSSPSSITLDNTTLNSSQWSYNGERKVVELQELEIPLSKNFQLIFHYT